MKSYRPPLGPLLGELEPHMLLSDLQEIKKITEEIQLRIARFENRGNPR
jgi:hypothetical protein